MAFKSGTGTIQRFFEITPQTLELSFSNYGHFISYPFINNNKTCINYVFIPNKLFQNSNEILDLSLIHI